GRSVSRPTRRRTWPITSARSRARRSPSRRRRSRPTRTAHPRRRRLPRLHLHRLRLPHLHRLRLPRPRPLRLPHLLRLRLPSRPPSPPPLTPPPGADPLLSQAQTHPTESPPPTDGRYKVSMQRDGNLAIYGQNRTPLWASNTATGAASFVAMQGDGNLVV